MRAFKSIIGIGFAALSLVSQVQAVEPICPGGSNPDPNVLFCDDFESGTLDAWDYLCCPIRATINGDITYKGSNYAVRMLYDIPSDWGAEHQDKNIFIEEDFDPGLDHFFIRGYVYFGRPVDPNIQRKLFYLKSPSGPKGTPNYYWAIVLNSYNFQLAVAPAPPSDSAFQPCDNCVSWNLYSLNPERWYCLEMEVKANTPGERDGYVKVWVDNQLVLNRQNMNLRGNYSLGITRFQIGHQADRQDYIEVNEYRWWDNIVISTSRIGCLEDPIPAPPTNLQVERGDP